MEALWTFFSPTPAPVRSHDSEPEPKRARSSTITMPSLQPTGLGHTTAAANNSVAAGVVPSGLHYAIPAPAPCMIPSAAPASSIIFGSSLFQNNTLQEETLKETTRKRKNAQQARKSRERKRNLERSLQMELVELERENARLRALVKTHLPTKSQEIIGECCYKQRGGGGAGGGGSLFPSSSKMVRCDFDLIESLTKTRQSFLLTDPRLADNPVVYASLSFLRLTGYTREQVIGRNCRFLQGIDTDPAAVAVIRTAIESGKDGATCLLNYKADGTPFWNQFFVAALRDCENQIVNYVGVIHEVDVQTGKKLSAKVGEQLKQSQQTASVKTAASAAAAAAAKRPDKQLSAPVVGEQWKQQSQQMASSSAQIASEPSIPMHDAMMATDLTSMDWVQLAMDLEDDYQDDIAGWKQGGDVDTYDWLTEEGEQVIMDSTCEEEEEEVEKQHTHNVNAEVRIPESAPSQAQEFVKRTVRSELIDSLLCTHGDVTDRRFLSALDVLSGMFGPSSSSNNSVINTSSALNGSWRSISRPPYSYGGLLGKNERGDFVYTLGKMCFNMFKPGNVRCSVQETLNTIEPVCQMDNHSNNKAAPRAAPWSLRRELALQDPPEHGSLVQQPNATMLLKSYNIVVALTIEPGQFMAAKNEVIPSPPCRFRATHVAHGFFLPDPKIPHRLTVWFTGGDLAPAPSPLPEEKEETNASGDYGNLQDWKTYFSAEFKRSWSEAISVMGAKLFLGAEFQPEMDTNGKMSYTLHRPYGGHGKGYVDVLYIDEDLLITKGNSGTIHVMVAQH